MRPSAACYVTGTAHIFCLVPPPCVVFRIVPFTGKLLRLAIQQPDLCSTFARAAMSNTCCAFGSFNGLYIQSHTHASSLQEPTVAYTGQYECKYAKTSLSIHKRGHRGAPAKRRMPVQSTFLRMLVIILWFLFYSTLISRLTLHDG